MLFTLFSFPAMDQSVAAVDHVVVYKHDRKLVLLSSGMQVKSYRVALGANPIGPKTREGDHRTPEGSYVCHACGPW